MWVFCAKATPQTRGDLAGRGHSFQRCPEGDLCKASPGRTSLMGLTVSGPVWGCSACPHRPSLVTRSLQLSVDLLLLL